MFYNIVKGVLFFIITINFVKSKNKKQNKDFSKNRSSTFIYLRL